MVSNTDRVVDYIAPDYIEEEKFSVSLESHGAVLYPNQPITVYFDYSLAGLEGPQLPIELVVQPMFGDGGAASGYFTKVFRSTVQNQYTFTVPSAGQYLIVNRELFHNRFFGRLVITAIGDSFAQVRLTRY